MHMQKSPKEKSCYTLPTVKKLLEQKRKRETCSAPPACAAASDTAGTPTPFPAPNPAPVSTTFPVSTSAPPASASCSYSDMTAMRYSWEPPHSYPGLQSCGSFPHIELSFGTSFPLGANLAPAPAYNLNSTELPDPGYSLHQPRDCPDGQIPQHIPSLECAVTVAVSNASTDTRSQAMSLSPGSWAPGPAAPCGFQYRTRMDMVKLEEARQFLQSMDYCRTTWQDDDGDTILHIYTAKGHREYAFAAAEKLQELGKLDSKEHKGKTALLVAVTANQPEIVQDLLSLGADISICDINGQTALHLAATYGFPEVMQVILSMDHGVDLEARNFEGLTPLHCAVISHGATMKALMASSSSPAWLPDVGLQSQADNKLSCLQMLLSAGASLLSQEIKSSKTVLHLAVKDGNIQLVHFFLKYPLPDMQAFINMKAHGHTALHMAAGLHASPDQEDLIRLLLNKGADPSVRNLENDQPAHLLQSGERGEKLKLILKKRNTSSRRRVASLQDQE